MTGKIFTSTRKLAMSSWGEGPGWGDLWSGSSRAPWESLQGSRYNGSHHRHHRGHSLPLYRYLLILTPLPDRPFSQPSSPTRPSSPPPRRRRHLRCRHQRQHPHYRHPEAVPTSEAILSTEFSLLSPSFFFRAATVNTITAISLVTKGAAHDPIPCSSRGPLGPEGS